MNKLKRILTFLLIFVAGIIGAFYLEENYRKLVRWLFNLFQGKRIVFFGKNFHLFASGYFLLAFGLFLVVLSLLLYKLNNRNRIFFSLWTITIFFASTGLTTYIDSTSKIVNCTNCQEGVKRLHYNSINYDAHFLVCLLVALLPLTCKIIRQTIAERRKKVRLD